MPKKSSKKKQRESVLVYYGTIPAIITAMTLLWIIWYLVQNDIRSVLQMAYIGGIFGATVFLQNMLITFAVKKKVPQKTLMLATLVLAAVVILLSGY